MDTPTITHTHCLDCGHESTEPTTLEMWNVAGICPMCYSTRGAHWTLSNGSETNA